MSHALPPSGVEPAAVTAHRSTVLARLVRAATGGALLGLVVRVSAAGLGYGLQIGMARLLGADEYGIFAIAWVWVAVGGFSGSLGLSQMAVRFLPTYREHGREGLRALFVIESTRNVALSGFLLGLAGAAFVLLGGVPAGANVLPFLLAAACVPVFAYQDLLEGFGRAHGWMGLALVPPYILRQCILMLVTIIAVSVGADASATTAMSAALVATIVATAIQHVAVHRAMRKDSAEAMAASSGAISEPGSRMERPPIRDERKLWRRSAFVVFLSDGALLLRGSVDIMLLALFVPPATLGVYFAATRVAAVLGFVEYAVGASAAHRFSALQARDIAVDGRQDALRQAATDAIRMTFWPTLLAACVLGVVAQPVLSLFGPDFASGANVALVLMAGYVARAGVGPADDLLVMLGREAWALAAQVLGLGVGIALILLYVPGHGMMAAAYATMAATVTTTLALAVGMVVTLRAPAPVQAAS